MKLFPTYEGNRPSGLGGDSEHTNTQTDRQTNRGVTSINKIDEWGNIKYKMVKV